MGNKRGAPPKFIDPLTGVVRAANGKERAQMFRDAQKAGKKKQKIPQVNFTSFAGLILQLAASRELGVRFRDLPTHATDLIKQADDKFQLSGGFEGIKALFRNAHCLAPQNAASQ